MKIDALVTKGDAEQDFTNKLEDIVMKGFTCLSLALGHKLRLFDHVTSKPKTSQEIAASANMRERYVREWLNAMVVGEIVEVDKVGSKFWIPSPRKKALSEDSSLLLYSTNLPVLSSVFETLASCFHPEGPRGIPYGAYHGFFEYMTNVSDQVHETNLLTNFLPSVPDLISQLKDGITCLDIGCGRGTPSYLMADTYPNSEFHGIDFSTCAIEFAEGRAQERENKNLHYHVMDCTKLPKEWTGKFDYITAFDSIHDQAYPDKALEEIYRVLKPGGRFSLVDIDAHTNVSDNKPMIGARYMYTASLFHCMPVSLHFENGVGLGAMWGREKAQEMLQTVGFNKVLFNKQEFNAYFNYHCMCEKPF